jgi:hypothetical protein
MLIRVIQSKYNNTNIVLVLLRMEISSYTEGHRASYMKNHEKQLERSRAYYAANKTLITERRKIQYNLKKAKLADEKAAADLVATESEADVKIEPLSDEDEYIKFLENCENKVWNKRPIVIIESMSQRKGPGTFQRKNFRNFVYVLSNQFNTISDDDYYLKVGKMNCGFLGSLYNDTNKNFTDVEKHYIMRLHLSLGANDF